MSDHCASNSPDPARSSGLASLAELEAEALALEGIPGRRRQAVAARAAARQAGRSARRPAAEAPPGTDEARGALGRAAPMRIRAQNPACSAEGPPQNQPECGELEGQGAAGTRRGPKPRASRVPEVACANPDCGKTFRQVKKGARFCRTACFRAVQDAGRRRCRRAGCGVAIKCGWVYCSAACRLADAAVNAASARCWRCDGPMRARADGRLACIGSCGQGHSDALREKVRQLSLAKLPLAEISRLTGLNTNQLAGMRKRMGCTGENPVKRSAIPSPHALAQRARRAAARVPGLPPTPLLPAPATPPPAVPVPNQDGRPEGPRTVQAGLSAAPEVPPVPPRLAERREAVIRRPGFATCQWLTGNRRPWIACGEPLEGKSPYCAEHFKLAYVKTKAAA